MQRLQLKMQVWRNWQTRMVQVHMSASSCRFKSCHLHQEFVLLNELLLFLQDLNFQAPVTCKEGDVHLNAPLLFYTMLESPQHSFQKPFSQAWHFAAQSRVASVCCWVGKTLWATRSIWRRIRSPRAGRWRRASGGPAPPCAPPGLSPCLP